MDVQSFLGIDIQHHDMDIINANIAIFHQPQMIQ